MALNLTEFFRESISPYLALIKPRITALEDNTHTHANKDVLDTLTDNQAEVDAKFAAKADLISGKVPVAQLPDSILGGMVYKGTWDASTALPAAPEKGFYYVVSAAGNTEVAGKTDLEIGDYIVYDGAAWSYIDNSEKAVVVAGDDLIAPFTVVLGTEAQTDWDAA